MEFVWSACGVGCYTGTPEAWLSFRGRLVRVLYDYSGQIWAMTFEGFRHWIYQPCHVFDTLSYTGGDVV